MGHNQVTYSIEVSILIPDQDDFREICGVAYLDDQGAGVEDDDGHEVVPPCGAEPAWIVRVPAPSPTVAQADAQMRTGLRELGWEVEL